MSTRTHRLRASHTYRPVLGLLLASFVFTAFAPDAAWARGALLLLETVTLLLALWTSRSDSLGARLALTGVAAVIAVLQLATGGRELTIIAVGLDGCFVVATAVVVGRGVIRQGEVNQQSVIGAICIYMLTGLLFAYLYGVIAVAGSGPLFAQGTDGTSAVRQYFSFVTLTTVGYGDYAPAGDTARVLANVESLFGQLYLVTVIAILVSRIRPRDRRAP